MLLEKQELVRRFFEDDDFRSVADEICQPDMEPAVKAYLLDQYYRQKDFAELDFTRLVISLGMYDSAALKEVLFRGLDLWAACRFERGTKIGEAMEAYILRVSQCLEDRFSPEMYVNPTGLRHVELLKQYLNSCFQDEGKAALWAEDFPECFDNVMRYSARWEPPRLDSAFPLLFLLMMLDQEQRKTSPATELDVEPLSMLVRCGYQYLLRTDSSRIGFEGIRVVPYSILSAIADTAVQHQFYLRDDHEEAFPMLLCLIMRHCVHAQTLQIIQNADKTLRGLFLKQMKRLAIPEKNDYFRGNRRYITELIHKVPGEWMKDLELAWTELLEKASKL